MVEQTTSPRLTTKFIDALAYAAEKHNDQTRKGGDIPYIGHLRSVAGLVIEADGDETQAIAAASRRGRRSRRRGNPRRDQDAVRPGRGHHRR
jgi:hypothetical protein